MTLWVLQNVIYHTVWGVLCDGIEGSHELLCGLVNWKQNFSLFDYHTVTQVQRRTFLVVIGSLLPTFSYHFPLLKNSLKGFQNVPNSQWENSSHPLSTTQRPHPPWPHPLPRFTQTPKRWLFSLDVQLQGNQHFTPTTSPAKDTHTSTGTSWDHGKNVWKSVKSNWQLAEALPLTTQALM